jgi:hypothetical protein
MPLQRQYQARRPFLAPTPHDRPDAGAGLDCLHPGGTLAFSQRLPVEGGYGCQASYIPRGEDEDALVVRRWDHEPHIWISLLRESGFTDATARVMPAPPGNRKIGTLIVTARG